MITIAQRYIHSYSTMNTEINSSIVSLVSILGQLGSITQGLHSIKTNVEVYFSSRNNVHFLFVRKQIRVSQVRSYLTETMSDDICALYPESGVTSREPTANEYCSHHPDEGAGVFIFPFISLLFGIFVLGS